MPNLNVFAERHTVTFYKIYFGSHSEAPKKELYYHLLDAFI